MIFLGGKGVCKYYQEGATQYQIKYRIFMQEY